MFNFYPLVSTKTQISDDPSAWMVITPKAVAFAPAAVADGQVTTAVRLVASVKTVIGEQPTDPKGPFPNVVEMPSAPPAFEMHVPLLASLDSLADHANMCCVPASIPVGSKTLTVHSLNFVENRGKLVIEAKFRTGWFGARGTMYLEGTPALSADHNTLEFKNLDFDVRTRNTLLDGAAEIAKPAVLEGIARKLRVDLRPLYEAGLADVRKRAANLKVVEGVDVSTNIRSVMLEDVLVGGGQLVAVGAATGTLSVAIR